MHALAMENTAPVSFIRHSVCIILCILFSLTASAQTSATDSLKKVLSSHTAKDTAYIHILIDLCKVYVKEEEDKVSIQPYAAKLINVSQQLKFKKGLAYGYLYTGINNPSGNYLLALQNCFKALQIMQEINDKEGMGECYYYLGIYKYEQSDFANSIKYAQKAVVIKKELNNKKEEGNCYYSMGSTYTQMGNFAKALESYFTAIKLAEQLGDNKMKSKLYVCLGSVFFLQNKDKEGSSYQNKAIAIAEKIGDRRTEAHAYTNLGNNYAKINDNKKAESYLLKASEIYQGLGSKREIAMIYECLGPLYINMKQVNKAQAYYLKAIALCNESSDHLGLIYAYTGLGYCYESGKNYKTAISYYQKSLDVSKKIDYKRGIQQAYGMLSDVHEFLKDYSSALKYHKLFSNMKDSSLNEANIKQAAELNARYDVDKKENEILLLTKDQQLKDKTLKEQRLVRIGLIIGLGLLLALSFLLYNRYRFKQKANLLLEKQKELIHQKNTLITDSIDYAKTIQEAILPDDEKLHTFFPDHFILYKPKAIVSGDFYWIGKKDDTIICAVADCTGHGVPGAFMSLLGHNILENVVQRDTSINPAAILSSLNSEIVTRFSKTDELETVKHGMDIAIISIDTDKKQVQYAGARNALYIVRSNELIEIKADKQSTGIVSKDHTPINYTNNTHDLQKGDMLYLFTDGFPDQKGGPDKKKFYYQPFKELLVRIAHLTPQEQKQGLETAITSWIADGEQIDDILIMGIRQ